MAEGRRPSGDVAEMALQWDAQIAEGFILKVRLWGLWRVWSRYIIDLGLFFFWV